MPSSHRILRQRWLVKAPSQEAAFAIRQQLRSQLETMLQPAFEHAFDMLATGDDVVHIPRLSLHLKMRPNEDFVVALTDALRDSLSEVLQEAVVSHPEQAGVQRLAAQASRRHILLSYLADGQLEWHARSGESDDLVQVLREEAAALARDGQAALRTITGSLSQRIAAGFRLLQLVSGEQRSLLLALAPLYTAAELQAMPAAKPRAEANLLPIVLQRLPAAVGLRSYQRLRIQALLLALREEDTHSPPDADILALLRECLGQLPNHATVASLRTVLQAMTNPAIAVQQAEMPHATTPAPNAAQTNLATHGADTLSVKIGNEAPANLAGSASSNETDAQPVPDAGKSPNPTALSGPESENSIKLPPTATTTQNAKSPTHSPLKPCAGPEMQSDKTEGRQPGAGSAAKSRFAHISERGGANTSAISRAPATSAAAANQARDIASTVAMPVAHSLRDGPDRSGSYAVGDAGLVLLHPFLARLFDAVGIAPAGTNELAEAILPRAAALLHWLMSGREEVFEFELTIVKVLLGLTPDRMLLVNAGLLSEADKEEADALLAAAITHWSALGKTGVAALRMSFLQRRGLLHDIGSGWQLQVEPEPFDLLLGKLPWGISIVRLPWMTRPIFIEWPTP